MLSVPFHSDIMYNNFGTRFMRVITFVEQIMVVVQNRR